MLLNFRIKNYGPFRNGVVFSMESTALGGSEDNLLKCTGSSYPLLGSAVIFGPNASGKSYVLRAVGDLQNMVRAAMPPNIVYPWYQPFRVSDDTIGKPVEFGICVVENGVKYDYSVAFLKDSITKESLYHYPRKKRALVFRRDGQKYTFGRMKGLKASSILTSRSSSFLALAAQYNNSACLAAHKAITDILVIGSNPSSLLNSVIDRINTNPETKMHMLKALRIADFGIVDAKGIVQTKKLTEMREEIPTEIIGLMMMTGNVSVNQNSLFLTHSFANEDRCGKQSDNTLVDFPFEIESNGTMQFFCLMGPVIHALENGYTIMLDEFGTFLHSDISKWIISQFRNSANPNKAQLVVNTQDQSLLDLGLLRRDQIWFTDKGPQGKAELYAMSDFNGIRQDADVRKSYSAGKFDAKPFVKYEDVMD